MFQSPNNSFIFGSVPREHYGVASGFIATIRNVGGSLSITLWGTILTAQMASRGFKGRLGNPASTEDVMPVFLDGLHLAIYAAMAVVCVGILASVLRGARLLAPVGPAVPS